MKRPLYCLLLTLLAACTLQSEPVEETTAELTLSASFTEGVAPLEVTFTAAPTVDNAEVNGYTWRVAGTALTETSPELIYTFETPGVYIVTATANTNVGSVSDSATVTVAQADTPPEEPNELVDGTLSVTKTPGGPAPWAVRYTVELEGYDPNAQFRVHCSAEGDASYPAEGGAVCLYTTSGEQAQVDVLLSGEVIDSTLIASEVTPPQDDIAFLGTWRYTSRGVSETFELTRGTALAGESEAGDFKLFLIKLDGLDIAEFTFGGRTVVLSPTPEEDGTQVFFADVYGLVLERLD